MMLNCVLLYRYQERGNYMSTKNEIQQFVSKLNKDEIKSMIEYLQSLLLSDKITPINENMCCPVCGSVHFKKNGHDENHVQRYFCNHCHASFSGKTNVFFCHCRLPKEKWMKFIDLEITGMSLREEAYYLKLSMTTCFYMRHKLYRCLSLVYDEEKVTSEVELDAFYMKISLKGTKPQNMPRYSKKRGNTSAYSGISHHKICAIAAIDTEDHMLMRIAGLGSESLEKYEAQKERFQNVKKVISDSKPCIRQFSNAIGSSHEAIPVIAAKKRYTTSDGKHLGDVNELIEGFRTSNKYKHGTGTRYLQDELNFYTIKKQLKYQLKREEIAGFIFDLLCKARFISTQEILSTKMPISLKEAYFDYHYGIFNDNQQHLS